MSSDSQGGSADRQPAPRALTTLALGVVALPIVLLVSLVIAPWAWWLSYRSRRGWIRAERRCTLTDGTINISWTVSQADQLATTRSAAALLIDAMASALPNGVVATLEIHNPATGFALARGRLGLIQGDLTEGLAHAIEGGKCEFGSITVNGEDQFAHLDLDLRSSIASHLELETPGLDVSAIDAAARRRGFDVAN